MSTPSDLDLILAMQQHSEVALTTLYERYFTKLYNYFYYRVYDQAIAEDLNADTRMQIFEKVASFDANRSTNVSGWMYRIAHNKLVDHWRSHQPEQSLQEDRDTVSYHPDLLAQTNAKVLREKILPTLASIHPHAQDILLMKVWEHMSHEEIAQQLDISLANSKKIYSRTLQHLQTTYGDLVLCLLFICTLSCNT